MSRLFLDANIVVDLLEERQPFCDFTLSKIPVMTASEYLAMLK